MRSFVAGSVLLSLSLAAGQVAFAKESPVLNTSPLTLQEDGNVQSWGSIISGQIFDEDGKAMSEASVVLDGREYFADDNGKFQFAANGSKSPLLIKKAGYRKLRLMPQHGSLQPKLFLQPVKGVYVPWSELANDAALENVLSLIEKTELNGFVIDVKGDGGDLHLSLQKDDQGRIVEAPDPKLVKAVNFLHDHDIYAIARVVAFKDTHYSKAHPELGLKSAVTGGLWADHKGNTYLNPYSEGAQEYITGIARIAALSGFDEIQFDYVRFPTDGDLKSVAWTKPYNAENRTDAIASFLKLARAHIGPQGTFVAADIFGISAYEKNDISAEGQNIEKIAPHLDYICPMVYPSGFAMNTRGFGNPVDHPREIVEDSVGRIHIRAADFSVIRPWLQAFRDYAYNHRVYGAEEIRAQIDGSDAAGGEGFLLWNASGHYTDAGLKPKAKRPSLLN